MDHFRGAENSSVFFAYYAKEACANLWYFPFSSDKKVLFKKKSQVLGLILIRHRNFFPIFNQWVMLNNSKLLLYYFKFHIKILGVIVSYIFKTLIYFRVHTLEKLYSYFVLCYCNSHRNIKIPTERYWFLERNS